MILGRIQYGISVYGRLPVYQQQRLQTIILTAARICLGHNFSRSSTSVLLKALKWPSIQQMLEMADSKLIHQALITKTPLSLHSRVGRPMMGATREAAKGSMQLTRRNRLKFRRTISHESLARYNTLPLSSKLSGSKHQFKREIRRYVLMTRTPYLRAYDSTVLAQHIEKTASPRDIQYTTDETGALRRVTIPHRTYVG